MDYVQKLRREWTYGRRLEQVEQDDCKRYIDQVAACRNEYAIAALLTWFAVVCLPRGACARGASVLR